MKIQDKVAEIAKLCVEVTMNTDHDVFFEYQAHVNNVETLIHHNGWEQNSEFIDCSLEHDNALDHLNSIIEQLQDLLK